jgi:hypothetical protein
MIRRAVEEGIPGGLKGPRTVHAPLPGRLVGLDGGEVRTCGEILHNSLSRFNDDLFINGHAFGALAGQSPVMHLKRQPCGQMWDHFMRPFERTWELGVPEKGLGVMANVDYFVDLAAPAANSVVPSVTAVICDAPAVSCSSTRSTTTRNGLMTTRPTHRASRLRPVHPPRARCTS